MLLSSFRESNFPGITQTDHPTLTTPCWLLHPCETSHTVVELLKSRMEDDKGFTILPDDLPVVWVETWFAVISGIIRLDTGLVEKQ
jgi:ubiquitin-like-conjugating enzyme ATG10